MDLHLIQALHETRELADDHPGEDRWQQLRAQVDDLLDQLTADADDPTTERIGAQRILRPEHTPEEAEIAIAALTAVHDRPEAEQLELASAAVEQLRDVLV